jgi:hypothetical protein
MTIYTQNIQYLDFNLGVREGLWTGSNPFLHEFQCK